MDALKLEELSPGELQTIVVALQRCYEDTATASKYANANNKTHFDHQARFIETTRRKIQHALDTRSGK